MGRNKRSVNKTNELENKTTELEQNHTQLQQQVTKIDQTYLNKTEYPTYTARGCLACHNTQTGFTLVLEAYRCPDHPYLGNATDPQNENNSVEACMDCHGAGSGERAGMGKNANLTMAKIVHPSHMYSPTFKYHYAGNCFSCHTVNMSTHEYELLTQPVSTDSLGVPQQSHIPGTMAIHNPKDFNNDGKANFGDVVALFENL